MQRHAEPLRSSVTRQEDHGRGYPSPKDKLLQEMTLTRLHTLGEAVIYQVSLLRGPCFFFQELAFLDEGTLPRDADANRNMLCKSVKLFNLSIDYFFSEPPDFSVTIAKDA